MIQTILLATDGLAPSNAAHHSAIELAKRFRATVTALGMIDAPWITRPEPVPLGGAVYKFAGEAEQLKSAHQHVQDAFERIHAAAAACGVALATTEREGDPLALIKAAAIQRDLVVIGRGTSCRPGAAQGVSSLVEAVVREGDRAVLMVSRPAAVGDRVLVAFDGSVPASRAMHMAALLGLLRQGQVQVLSIAQDVRAAEELAEGGAALVRSHGGSATATGIGSEADPAEVILAQAKRFRADLIVMGAYGHGGLRDMIFGSATRRILAEGRTALLLQH